MTIQSFNTTFNRKCLQQLDNSAQCFEKGQHTEGLLYFTLANLSVPDFHANKIFGLTWNFKGSPKGDPEYGRHVFCDGSSLTDKERAVIIRCYLTMIKNFEQRFDSAAVETKKQFAYENAVGDFIRKYGPVFNKIIIGFSVVRLAASFFNRNPAPPKEYPLLPGHVVVGGGHFTGTGGHVALGGGHLLNVSPAAKIFLPSEPNLSSSAKVIYATYIQQTPKQQTLESRMDIAKGRLGDKIILAHVTDVEVRTPEWDRVQQEAADRAWERDYSERVSRDPNDVRASDAEHMS